MKRINIEVNNKTYERFMTIVRECQETESSCFSHCVNTRYYRLLRKMLRKHYDVENMTDEDLRNIKVEERKKDYAEESFMRKH